MCNVSIYLVFVSIIVSFIRACNYYCSFVCFIYMFFKNQQPLFYYILNILLYLYYSNYFIICFIILIRICYVIYNILIFIMVGSQGP